MSRPDHHQQLDRDRVKLLLADLGQKLEDRGLTANVQIVGGAAIALTLRDERLTQDVDAVVLDHSEEFHQAAREVAAEHGIQPDWISDDVSDFVSRTPSGEPTEMSMPGLNCYVASPEHLLAMKVRASTVRMADKDAVDLVFIAEHLGLRYGEEVADLTAQQFQGIYRDSIGYDEYLETARDAFMVHDLQHGIDPMIRLERREPEAQIPDHNPWSQTARKRSVTAGPPPRSVADTMHIAPEAMSVRERRRLKNAQRDTSPLPST